MLSWRDHTDSPNTPSMTFRASSAPQTASSYVQTIFTYILTHCQFPPAPSKPILAESNMHNPPAVIIEEPSTPIEDTANPLNLMKESNQPRQHPVDTSIYRTNKLRDLERPDISAIRRQVLVRPSTSMGSPQHDTLLNQTRTGPILMKSFPPRSTWVSSL